MRAFAVGCAKSTLALQNFLHEHFCQTAFFVSWIIFKMAPGKVQSKLVAMIVPIADQHQALAKHFPIGAYCIAMYTVNT